MLKKLIVILLSTVLVLGAMLSLYKQEIAIMISIGQAKLEQMLNGEQVKPDNPPVDGDSAIESISIDTSGAKLVYDFADEFTAEGLKVIATMSDGSKKEIPLEDCRISPADTTKPGVRQVVVIYEGKSARYDVKVNLKVIPEISATPLLNINKNNETYRVEAEDIDMATPGAKLESGADSFVATGADETSGGKYLTGYGVAWNYFGFTFTAADEYKDTTLVLRVANSTAADINAGAVKMYLNFSQDDEGVASGEIPLEGYIIEANGACNWSEIVIRNLTIPAGTNTLTLENQEDKAFDIDYIDFYVGKPYVKSIVEITDTTTVVKDLESLDTEKAFTRSDVAEHWGLKDGQLFVEKVSKESPGKSTNGGMSVGAIGQGSQISTYLYVAEDATVRIMFKASCVAKGAYYVADHWSFYIDGVKLTTVERVNIEGGDSSNGFWWDWIYTNVGDINLTAGYHSFILEVHGTDCNVDTVEFQAISLGSFAESGRDLTDMHDCVSVCPECGKCTNAECDKKVCADKCKGHENVDPNFNITVSTDTEYKFEGEKVDKTNLTPASGWEDRGVQVETPTSSSPITSGNKSLGACGGGYTTITIKLLEKATIQIFGRIAESKGGAASNLMVMSLGDTELVAIGNLPAGISGNQYWNWADIPFGTALNLEAGEYTLTITFKTGVNLDCIKVKALSYGEFAEIECDSICDICGKCTDAECLKAEHVDKCNGHATPNPGEDSDVVVATTGTTRLEMETIDLSRSTIVSDQGAVNKGYILSGQAGGHKDAKTGQKTRLYWFRQGTKFVIMVKVEEACTLDIALVGWGSKNLNAYSYSFGGEKIDCTVDSSLGGSESAPDSKSIGTVTVDTPGIYQFELEICDIDFDAITFTVVE